MLGSFGTFFSVHAPLKLEAPRRWHHRLRNQVNSRPVQRCHLRIFSNFPKNWLAVAFASAGISDAIGAFTTPLPPIGWVVDLATALLLFMVLGRQWLLLPGLALEAIPGLGILPFWLLVVGAIAVLGTPRPSFERH